MSESKCAVCHCDRFESYRDPNGKVSNRCAKCGRLSVAKTVTPPEAKPIERTPAVKIVDPHWYVSKRLATTQLPAYLAANCEAFKFGDHDFYRLSPAILVILTRAVQNDFAGITTIDPRKGSELAHAIECIEMITEWVEWHFPAEEISKAFATPNLSLPVIPWTPDVGEYRADQGHFHVRY